MSEFVQRHEDVDYIHDDHIDQYLTMLEQDRLPSDYDYLRQHIDWEGVVRDEKTSWTVVTLDVHSDGCQESYEELGWSDCNEDCLVGDYWTQDL